MSQSKGGKKKGNQVCTIGKITRDKEEGASPSFWVGEEKGSDKEERRGEGWAADTLPKWAEF